MIQTYTRYHFLLLFFLGISPCAFGQHMDDTMVKQFDERVTDEGEELITEKQDQFEDVKDITRSSFYNRKKAITDTPLKLSTRKRHTAKTTINQFDFKNSSPINKPQNMGYHASRDRLNNSLSRDWEFETDGHSNNMDALKDQSLGIFKNESSFYSQTSFITRSGLPSGTQSLDPGTFKEQVRKNQNGEEDLANISKASRKLTGIQIPESIFGKPEPDVQGSMRAYSEKALQQARDTLGGKQLEKVARALRTVAKKDVSEQDLLQALRQSAPGNSMPEQLDTHTGTLKTNETDFSQVKLQEAALAELTPLAQAIVPSKYVDVVDSLRELNLKRAQLQLDEKKITEESKAVILRKKPRFFDKAYGEAIIGFFQNGNVTIFQASPSLGYHFTKHLSFGLGPSVLVHAQERELKCSVGLRSFIKTEVYKHRAYLQVEDNIEPSPVRKEILQQSPQHRLLGGGGFLLPLSERVALNLCLLYRFVPQEVMGSSPWVFRLGISSRKNR